MLIKNFKGLLIASLLVFTIGSVANAAESHKLTVKSVSIKLDGVANKGENSQHYWDASYVKINLDTDFVFNASLKDAQELFKNTTQTKKLIMSIPDIEDVTSTNSPAFMFKKFYFEAMKSDKHKSIVFSASRFTAAPDKTDKNRYILSIPGTLKIAGVEKPVTVDMVAMISEKAITFSGVKVIDMADFGIIPPKMSFPKKSNVDSKATVKWVIVAALDKK